MKEYFVAADIGGTSIKCAIKQENGEILTQFSVPTLVDKETPNSNSILNNLEEHINEELIKNNLTLEDDILAIGLTVPGKFNHKNQIVKIGPNINWKEYPVVEEAKKIWPNQVIYCLNDAEAAALGQSRISGEPNIVLYILGTGVGTSIIRNDHLILEENGDGIFSVGGEGGHHSDEFPEQHSEIQCPCGACGCLETVASARAINEQLNECENLTDEELEEINQFKKNNGLEEFDTFALNKFIEGVEEDDLRLSLAKKMLKKPMAALATSIKGLCSRKPELNDYSFFIAGGGAMINESLILSMLKDELESDDSLLASEIKLKISDEPAKLALQGIIHFSEERLNEKQIVTKEENNSDKLQENQISGFIIN